MLCVQVPATSANLGAGFDSLGLALTLYDRFWMEESDQIDITSLDGTAIPTDENNLIYRSAAALYQRCGRQLYGLKLRQKDQIPMARGLGSSSACIVGGLAGANALLGGPLTTEELLDMACELEGHPDNVAPALLGGVVVAAIEGQHAYHVKELLRDDLCFAALIPPFELRTAEARAALPQMVEHRDAVYGLSRAALMFASLASGRYENLRVAAGDRLHQSYRLPLIAGGQEAIELLYEQGAYAAFISGAGPTIMGIFSADKVQQLQKQLPGVLCGIGLSSWDVQLLQGQNEGVKILEEQL